MQQQQTNPLRKIHAELIALLLLVPLSIVLGFVIVRSPHQPNSGQEISDSKLAQVKPSSPPPTPTVAAAESVSLSLSPREIAGQTTTLKIQGPHGEKIYTLPVQEEQSVAELLTRAAQDQGLAMETKDYGPSLGIFVESLAGTANDPSKNMYWHLYINGEFSQLGASSARVSAGDTVTWVYESMHEE